MRPPELAVDNALAVPTLQHAVLAYEKNKGFEIDVIVMLQPTAPLRNGDDIDLGIRKLLENRADGVISIVSVNNHHPYKMKTINNGYLKDYQETGLENPPRQLLPQVYIVNGALYICKRDTLMKKNSFKGDICLPFIMPDERSANIDSLVDFAVAEFYMKQSNK
jgi:CMP-N-acetylneuraminic acid synthetase